jgi:hypothetical protein
MNDVTYHFSVQEGIVEIRVGFEKLTSQIACVLDVLEQGYMNWIRLIVRQRERPY